MFFAHENHKICIQIWAGKVPASDLSPPGSATPGCYKVDCCFCVCDMIHFCPILFLPLLPHHLSQSKMCKILHILLAGNIFECLTVLSLCPTAAGYGFSVGTKMPTGRIFAKILCLFFAKTVMKKTKLPVWAK